MTGVDVSEGNFGRDVYWVSEHLFCLCYQEEADNSSSICESTCDHLTSDSDASPMKPPNPRPSSGVVHHHNMQLLAGLDGDDVPPLVDNPLL